MEQEWRSYEEVARYLLNQFAEIWNLSSVEGKQSIKGSCTDWEIDAKGINIDGEGFIIVECRRHTTSKISQEAAAAVAYRITDTGAAGAIIVSPLGFQLGAKKIANASNIHSVKLNQNSTIRSYFMEFLNKTMIGMEDIIQTTDSFSVTLIRTCENCKNKFEKLDNMTACPYCSTPFK